MDDQQKLKLRLCALLHDFGTPITYIARAIDIDQSQLNKFKLGKLCLEPSQAQRLDTFLRERGYNNAVNSFAACVQGTFSS